MPSGHSEPVRQRLLVQQHSVQEQGTETVSLTFDEGLRTRRQLIRTDVHTPKLPLMLRTYLGLTIRKRSHTTSTVMLSLIMALTVTARTVVTASRSLEMSKPGGTPGSKEFQLSLRIKEALHRTFDGAYKSQHGFGVLAYTYCTQYALAQRKSWHVCSIVIRERLLDRASFVVPDESHCILLHQAGCFCCAYLIAGLEPDLVILVKIWLGGLCTICG